MTDKTTIQLEKSTKSDLDELKRVDGESYDSVVKMLIAKHNNESDVDETVAEWNGQLTYDDVKQACQKALEEELPEGQYR